jgi:antitoxin (DNA-binding transcriptional repressor) of toxin-antitoxin stability system
MSTYTVYNAKARLSSLIDQACAGEEVIIARGKRPMVKLVPLSVGGKGRQFGAMRGRATAGEAFFEPLPEDELRGWESPA